MNIIKMDIVNIFIMNLFDLKLNFNFEMYLSDII